MVNCTNRLRVRVEDRPKDPAVVGPNEEVTYSNLWSRVERFAGGLRDRGVKSGDSVIVSLPNGVTSLVAFFGTLRNGSVAITVPPEFSAERLSDIVQETDADAIATSDERAMDTLAHDNSASVLVTSPGDVQIGVGIEKFLENDGLYDFWEVMSRDDDDVAVIAYSATETDDAVGVELTHANLASAADAVTDLVPGGLSSDDGQLGLLPASHVHGMVHEVIRALFNGLTYYPLRQRSLSRTLELIEREDITLVSMVTKMCRQMANWDRNDEYDLSSLRAVCVIGPPLPDATEQTIRSLYDGRLYRLYGTPETGSVALTVPDDTDWPADTLGTTVDDIDAKVVDETFREQMAVDDPTNDSADENGELVVSGPNVTRGYRGRSNLNGERFTEADGKRWFHTGATAYRDKQGLFYLEAD